jgi:hypothetical protein
MPDSDPEGTRLPIKLDSTSNGEFAPVPLWPANLEANRLAHQAAGENARRLGCSKRTFLTSACGAASTLLAFNAANAAAGRTGGFFDLPQEAALDVQLARAQVGPAKQEFILDVQGHFIDTPKGNPKRAEVFLKDVFMDSDTDVMVLSFVPSARNAEPVTIQAADAVRRLVDKLEGTHRLLLHGRVNPNQPGDLEGMDELHQKWGISAWKTYTQYGPNGEGYFLHDDVGIRFIEKAHRHADRFAAEASGQAEQQRVCRAGQHLALSHARPRTGGARPREVDPGVRREQRAVGHRLDLVRLAPGPDPGLPDFPDLRGAAPTSRVSGNHSGAARQGLRPERRERVRNHPGGREAIYRTRLGRAEACELPRESRSALQNLRAEDAARVPESVRPGWLRVGCLVRAPGAARARTQTNPRRRARTEI